MPKLEFIDSLTEARLFFGPNDVKGMKASEIAESVYLIFMLIEAIRHSESRWAANYAAQTMTYNTYENMHYSGTDLGNLLAVLNNQDTFSDRIKVDNNLSIPLFQINRYLGAVRSSNPNHQEDAIFFYRLEDYLRLYSSSVFRQLRRDIGNWNDLNLVDKKHILLMLRREFDKRMSSVDIYLWFKQSFKLKESVTEDINLGLAYHDELNPALWDLDSNLHDDVKEALGKIANKFAEFVDVKQLKIVDYIITGSNCAYNYTSQSDIDLHVIVDSSNLEKNPLVDPFLTAKKSLWNSGHDITVKGFTVELYAEDVNNEDSNLIATGVYSLLHDEWVKIPKHKNITIDDAAVRSKAEDIMQQIDALVEGRSEDLNDIDRLWKHIKKMRQSGLEQGGEFSVENLAYKVVRNHKYFDKLRDYERNIEDENLTLEQGFAQVA